MRVTFFYIIALISIVYGVTLSAFYVSLIPLTNMISGSLGGAIAPIIIDKWRLNAILSYSQLGKTLVLTILTCFCWFYLSNSSLLFVFLWVFLLTFLDGFALPANSSLIPSLVPPDQLSKANSLMSSFNQFIQLSGWSIGGVLADILEPKGLFILTWVLYVLSSLMMFLIADKGQKEKSNPQEGKLASFTEGWKIIIQNKSYRTIHVYIFFNAIANTVWVSAILYKVMLQRLKVNTGWSGGGISTLLC